MLDASAAVNAVPAEITNFSPTFGVAGESITINGVNFTRASAVQFNGINASFTILSSSVINAIVPAGNTTGPISVTNPGGTAISATNFLLPYQIFLPLVNR
jgi:hypothetical protein